MYNIVDSRRRHLNRGPPGSIDCFGWPRRSILTIRPRQKAGCPHARPRASLAFKAVVGVSWHAQDHVVLEDSLSLFSRLSKPRFGQLWPTSRAACLVEHSHEPGKLVLAAVSCTSHTSTMFLATAVGHWPTSVATRARGSLLPAYLVLGDPPAK